jgi:cwf18 pre-mRNA splicing factor
MEDAATRRARLKAIKAAAEAMEGTEEPVAEAEASAPSQKLADAEPTLKFRNYAPRDEKIAHEKASSFYFLSFCRFEGTKVLYIVSNTSPTKVYPAKFTCRLKLPKLPSLRKSP